ncbi:hypothetical protein FB45DRAFT_752730 [Roridomyces roridus]|uniref:Uncharacterized protein n=1 Tax=Roridomyces roridus TaxID=1738132 RepID=A0AAD7FH95_9AGAR|nr:hypothetical protein FB45DRAFT_752730 [Roridomyces roridus]
MSTSSDSTSPPPRKRRRLDEPVLVTRSRQQETAKAARQAAYKDLQRILKSQKQVLELDGGHNGLLSSRLRAIESTLRLMLGEGKVGMMSASRTAALAHGFAMEWGSRLVRAWTQRWVRDREMPDSRRSQHSKVHSIFDDPAVSAAVRSYLRSNKWSIDPGKLKQLVNNELDPKTAREYAEHITTKEMPTGLREYVETTLLPRLQLKKTGKGFSLSTMRRVLIREGFTKKASWVYKGEQPLLKKGVGQGHHRSEFLNVVDGHMPEAGQGLDYGKNHEGFWNGHLFVEQLQKKFIPAFERRHPGAVAVLWIDHSQGHAAWPGDALRASEMNFRAGGAQPIMRVGWYTDSDGERVAQPMIFAANHAQINFIEYFWGAVKRYLRENCDYTFKTLKENMPKAMASVSVELIRKWEHRAWRFIDAYKSGLAANEAQRRVKEFSSRKYKSHRRITERVASAMDA